MCGRFQKAVKEEISETKEEEEEQQQQDDDDNDAGIGQSTTQ